MRDAAALVGTALLLGWGIIQKYPNDAKQFAGQLLGRVSWLSRTIEREGIRQDLEGTLSAGLQELVVASPHATVPSVRFTFVRSQQDVRELADGSLVIGVVDQGQKPKPRRGCMGVLPASTAATLTTSS